jgi:TPR repeat protein
MYTFRLHFSHGGGRITMKHVLLCSLLVGSSALAQVNPAGTVRICDSSGCSDRPANSSTFDPNAGGDPAAEARIASLEALAAKDPRAAYDLGLRYFRGDGIPKNTFLALKWMREAGERGDFKAQQALGRFYLMGVEEMGADPGEAERWLMMAADKGDKEAKKLLTQAREAKKNEQQKYEWREADRKSWYGGWYSGYGYRSYWRGGAWYFY